MNKKLKIKLTVIIAVLAVCFAAIVAELIFGILKRLSLLMTLSVIQILAFALISTLIYKALKPQNSKSLQVADVADSLQHISKDCQNTAEKFSGLIYIIENLESNEPFKDILQFIYDSFSPYIPYSHIGVALMSENMTTIRAAYGVSGPQHPTLDKRFTGYKTDIRNTSLMRVLQNGQPRVINNLELYLRGREMREYNRILLEEGIKSSITFPLVKNGVPIGIIFFSSNQKNIYRKEHLEFLKTLAGSIMLSLEKTLLLDEMVVSSTLALATLAEERDNETGMHLVRMKRYATLLAELLSREDTFIDRIDTDFISSIERFSPLHDIGKVAISDSILLKPGKLTAAEFNIMKTHTTYGGKVLRLADENVKKHGHRIFDMGIEITEGHHEWWNGSGYPLGRSRDNIPLSARIVAVADVLDALMSKRPYKEPYSFEDSTAMIISESGSHFDPQIIDVFKDNLSAFKSMADRFSENETA